MTTKKELLELIETQSKEKYTKGEVKSFVNSVSEINAVPPSYFKKGDVVLNGVGAKKRPVVIVKVDGDVMYGIPTSTTKDDMNLCSSSSRFFGDHYFSKGLSCVSVEYAFSNYAGVYDNMSSLNKAIKLLQEQVKLLK